jgi:hypothetical protein
MTVNWNASLMDLVNRRVVGTSDVLLDGPRLNTTLNEIARVVDNPHNTPVNKTLATRTWQVLTHEYTYQFLFSKVLLTGVLRGKG